MNNQDLFRKNTEKELEIEKNFANLPDNKSKRKYMLELEEEEKKEKDNRSLNLLLEHIDDTKLNLNQGEYNNQWFFGKSIEINDRPVDTLIFSDGKVKINYKQSYSIRDKEYIEAENEINNLGISYSDQLIPLKNKWTNKGMKRYIKNLNVVSVDSVDYIEIPLVLPCLSPNPYYIYIHNNNNKLYTALHTTTSTTQTTLLTTLKNIQNYYMDVIDKRIFTIASLYTITTYFFELFNSIGYLFFCSDSGSGKTKFADIIRLTSFNSINATNPSESVLFRIIQQTKGTLFVDDYEKIEETKKGAIDQILKVGYKRGGQTVRSEKSGDNYMPRFFDVYSPKVITNTIGLDSITYSRCIPLHLLKTTTNKGRLNPNEFDPMWQDLRDLCYEFAMFNWKAIKEINNSINIPNLNNRDLELVKPLLVTAKLFGEDVYQEALEYLLKLFGERDMFDFTDDWDFVMFSCIKDYVGDSKTLTSEWLSPKKIETMMLNKINVQEGSAKPSYRWVGRILSKIELFKKRRKGAGVEYKFDSVSLEKYMKARGWYSTEHKIGESNE